MKKILFILAGVVILSFAIFNGKDVWMGFYYPDGCLSCSENYIYSPKFDKKDECFDWGENLKDSRNNPEDLFECGLNCKDKGGYFVCKETVD